MVKMEGSGRWLVTHERLFKKKKRTSGFLRRYIITVTNNPLTENIVTLEAN